jgi:hypothetical protein
MINKRINENKYRRKKIGGISTANNNNDNDDFNNIVAIYNLFSYLLLYISYILFCIATIIFLNALFNYNLKKASYNEKERKLDQPIFEYLKTNNFMYIDDYLLKADKDSIIFMTIVSILSISIFVIGCIIFIMYIYKDDLIINKILDNMKTLSFKLALIPYIFILIIIIIYNETKKNNYNGLNSLKTLYNKDINDTICKGNDTYLRKLKNKIINILENDLLKTDKYKHYNGITINGIKHETDDNKKITGSDFFDKEEKKEVKVLTIDNGKENILKKIFEIYENEYDLITDYDDKKEYKIKYIKHINDYFELLIKNKDEDFYKQYYILGLVNTKTNTGISLNNEFDNLFKNISSNITTHYITLIVLYVVLFLILLPVIIYYEKRPQSNIFIIDSLYYFDIGKIILSLCILAFIIYFALYYNK